MYPQIIKLIANFDTETYHKLIFGMFLEVKSGKS